MSTKGTRTRIDDQRKCHIDTKGPKERNRSKQLQTRNWPINDVENINQTNKGRDLLFAKSRSLIYIYIYIKDPKAQHNYFT